MVYYRKYRPQLISELDLNSVREKLSSILNSDNIPHAFLFSGPKGLGKTSSARILAKAINCENKKKNEFEPCNKCSACISITNGSAVDVLEIDAASNRGIDEIRDLRERIKFSPANLKKKIYIIDEVHMLTTEAFNALLKTLEEPPEHVVFILATTETGKLPPTIMSRVFQVTFEKPTYEEIARSLTRIVKGEKLDVDQDVLPKIAELSDGAFRDAAKILEELNLQAKGKKLTSEILELLYKTGSIDNSVELLLINIHDRKAKDALEVISNLASNNVDFKLVIEKMADKLHANLLKAVDADNKTDILSTQLMLELLDVAYKGLRGSVLPQLSLEIAIIEYLLGKQPKDTSSEVKVSNKEEKKIELKPQKQDLGTDPLKDLIEKVNIENKILAGLLRGCRLEESNGHVKIVAPSEFHSKKLNESQNRTIIERVLGRGVAIDQKS